MTFHDSDSPRYFSQAHEDIAMMRYNRSYMNPYTWFAYMDTDTGQMTLIKSRRREFYWVSINPVTFMRTARQTGFSDFRIVIDPIGRVK